MVPRLANDAAGLDLLARLLAYDPRARITAAEALRHPWFDDLRQAEAAAGPSGAEEQSSDVSDQTVECAAAGSPCVRQQAAAS